MKYEGTVLEQDSERDTRQVSDAMKALRSERNASGASTFARSAARPSVANPNRTLSEHIKAFFADLAKGMEGDQEHHKYR